MNKNRHVTFFVLERELFSLQKFQTKNFKKNSRKNFKKIHGTPRHQWRAVNLRHDNTCYTASLIHYSRFDLCCSKVKGALRVVVT